MRNLVVFLAFLSSFNALAETQFLCTKGGDVTVVNKALPDLLKRGFTDLSGPSIFTKDDRYPTNEFCLALSKTAGEKWLVRSADLLCGESKDTTSLDGLLKSVAEKNNGSVKVSAPAGANGLVCVLVSALNEANEKIEEVRVTCGNPSSDFPKLLELDQIKSAFDTTFFGAGQDSVCATLIRHSKY